MENGVKNLMGNESIPKTFANHGFGDDFIKMSAAGDMSLPPTSY
jgi:hypothetical protein